ncbi:MAG: DUF4922 domain-containing protein [Mangrovibacterium sp.]
MKIDCFIAEGEQRETQHTIGLLRASACCGSLFVLSPAPSNYSGAEILLTNRPVSVETIKAIARKARSRLVLLALSGNRLEPGQFALERMESTAHNTAAAMVYGDYYEIVCGERRYHAVTDCQPGSLRESFNFGPAQLYRRNMLEAFARETEPGWQHAGAYALRLLASRKGKLLRLPEPLFSVEENDIRESGAKQFDYLNPDSREMQREMEAACAAHLYKLGALLTPPFREVSHWEDFPVEASVVIPVRNRARTICDAVNSVLNQKTSFPFNLIVVDNHSTDGTTELLKQYTDKRLVRLCPQRTGLGIGGCWNEAIFHTCCGRFAVQLDSDDLYAGEDSLQKLVDVFHRERCAMVIGSYLICDYKLNPLPPGLIDHREWTQENGPNNALRINGLGAPRAFYTPVIREIRFPNTSYGEDYAVALAISRSWKTGRLYSPVYLCRRWEDNTDAALDLQRQNEHDNYKDRLRSIELQTRIRMNRKKNRISDPQSGKLAAALNRLIREQQNQWPLAGKNYAALSQVVSKTFRYEAFELILQHNPARMRSTAAATDSASVRLRPCFLCETNRPPEQQALAMDNRYSLLLNPFPVFPEHFTLVLNEHRPQQIETEFPSLLEFSRRLPAYTLLYNGPQCGASAPDHMHFQAVSRGMLPAEREKEDIAGRYGKLLVAAPGLSITAIGKEYFRKAVNLSSASAGELERWFGRILHILAQLQPEKPEPMLNLLCNFRNGRWNLLIFPREKQRPRLYHARGAQQLLLSPASSELGGLIILPREEDYNKIRPEQLAALLDEVSLNDASFKQLIKQITASR